MRLYFSRRRMLNRLSFTPTDFRDLADTSTAQTHAAAAEVLFDLKNRGLASWQPDGWVITDAGVLAMAKNSPTYALGVDEDVEFKGCSFE